VGPNLPLDRPSLPYFTGFLV